MTQPNLVVIMTDEERYPPPYETEEVKAFRKSQHRGDRHLAQYVDLFQRISS